MPQLLLSLFFLFYRNAVLGMCVLWESQFLFFLKDELELTIDKIYLISVIVTGSTACTNNWKLYEMVQWKTHFYCKSFTGQANIILALNICFLLSISNFNCMFLCLFCVFSLFAVFLWFYCIFCFCLYLYMKLFYFIAAHLVQDSLAEEILHLNGTFKVK